MSAHVATEGSVLALDGHGETCDDAACIHRLAGRTFAQTELGVVASLGTDNGITVGEGAVIDIGIAEPAALLGQGDLPATEAIERIDIGDGHIVGCVIVAVGLYVRGGLVDAYATTGLEDFLDGAVGIEGDLLDACRTTLVVARREVVAVIEDVPLALVFEDAVVVGPAGVVMLGHDDALEIPGAKGRA